MFLRLEGRDGRKQKRLDKLGILYTVYGEWLFKLRKEDERK